MNVLVDYDNVDRAFQRRGLVYIAERILETLGSARVAANPRIKLRLYGGWFAQSMASRHAQRLAAQVGGDFPTQLTVQDMAGSASAVVLAEFAYALCCDPQIALTHTFRTRAGVGNATCVSSPFLGCSNPTSCPLGPIYPFLNTGNCPVQGCTVAAADVLRRDEQKLVDTMIVSDLTYLANTGAGPIAVVSNDDDIWPGIRLALHYGVDIVHIHPIPGRATPAHYLVSLNSRYQQATIN